MTLGKLSEPMYEAIGRMTLAAASLEWMVASCLVVAGAAADVETALDAPVGKDMTTLNRCVQKDARVTASLKDLTRGWLTDSRGALQTRNRIVHSIIVIDGADDGGLALYHPRSQEMHMPSVEEVQKIILELNRCTGVGNKRSAELNEALA